jgi:hypothetical protein
MTLRDHHRLLERCRPFVLSHRTNWPQLDFEPLGIAIDPRHRLDPTTLRAAGIVEGLLRLDRQTFGHQAMGMPRWVLFDCAAFPGVVVGFGQAAETLPESLLMAYGLRPSSVFVPLSMWAAVRCASCDAWFGHNLSSANIVLPREQRYPGLGTVTKALGLAVTRATQQFGATQWDSAALPLHLRFGPLNLQSAWTPAHTHAASLTYRLDVTPDALRAAVRDEPPIVDPPDSVLRADDTDALHSLQLELEAGDDWALVGVDDTRDARTLKLRRVPSLPAAPTAEDP